MLIKVCADSIVIREGGGSIFLRERQGWGGRIQRGRESSPSPSHTDPTSLFAASLALLTASPGFLCHFFYLPVSLPSLSPCQSLCLSFCVSLSLYDLLLEGCLPTLLPLPVNGEPLSMCLCESWGYVCRHIRVSECVCGHVCMSEDTCVSELVCANVCLSPGASVWTPDCRGLCADTCVRACMHTGMRERSSVCVCMCVSRCV